MAEVVHERVLWLIDAKGTVYDRAFVHAEPQPGGTWAGWIEFVSVGGDTVVRTDRETTQSNVEGVAYWATGLEPTYFEGALARATRASEAEHPPQPAGPARGVGRVAELEVDTVDPEVPFRLMATRTLVPGLRRYMHNAGVLIYEGTTREPLGERPGSYRFIAQCGSDNGAAAMANTVWNDLHGMAARLRIDGVEVPLNHGAIKDALVGVGIT